MHCKYTCQPAAQLLLYLLVSVFGLALVFRQTGLALCASREV